MGWAEIKKAINSDLTKPLNTLITEVKTALESILNGKASQTSVTAVQTTANTINTNVNTLLSGRTVKSVQRGVYYATYTTDASFKEFTIPITSVNLSKSTLAVVSAMSYYTSGGTYNTSGSGDKFFAYLSSATTIKAFLSAYNASYQGAFSWEVVEYY